MTDDLMTLEEVASFLKVSRDTVYRLSQRGTLPAAKVGNQWRYRRPEISEWLASRAGAPLEEDSDKPQANTTANAHQFARLNPSITDNPLLREPQLEGYNELHKHFSQEGGEREVAVVLPVGCGKSGLLALSPFSIKARRALVIAPGLRIASQLLNEFKPSNRDRFYSKCKVLRDVEFPEVAEIRRGQSSIEDLELADVVVTNIQQVQGSENRWLQLLPPDFFDLILFDEGHHNVAESWKLLREKFPAAKIVNYSATPTRADGQRMEGKIVYQYPVFRAIERGYVKRLRATVLNPKTLRYIRKDDGRETEIDLEEVRRLATSDSQFRRGIVSSPETLTTIVDASIRKLEELRRSTGEHRLKIIASALNQEHCIQIKQAYVARGLRADYLHSNEDSKANEKVLKKLENNELDVIVQVRMLGEGFDHPHLAVAAVFSIFRSLTPFVQFIGRVMRSIDRNNSNSPLNQGVVVFHAGSNIARVWDDFRDFSQADQDFYDELLLPVEELPFEDAAELEVEPQQRNAAGERRVLISGQGEVHLEEIPLLQDTSVQSALNYLLDRGLTIEEFLDHQLARIPVSQQDQKRANRKALDERVQLEAGRVLRQRNSSFRGKDLDRPRYQRENYEVVKSAIDREISTFVGKKKNERVNFTHDDFRRISDQLPQIVSKVEKELFNG